MWRTPAAALAALSLLIAGGAAALPAATGGSPLPASSTNVPQASAPVVEPVVADLEESTAGEATVAQFGVVLPHEAAAAAQVAGESVEEGAAPPADDGAVTRVDDVLTVAPQDDAVAPEAVTVDGDDVLLDVVDDAARAASTVVELDEPFAAVGFTWPAGEYASPNLQVRVRALDGVWGEWLTLEVSDSAPDPDGADIDVRESTDPFWVDAADAVQIASTGDAAGAVPVDDVRLVTVSVPKDDTVTAEPAAYSATNGATATFAALPGAVATAASAPTIITRAQWGARAPKCTGSTGKTWGAASSLQAAVVHHTAGSNSYGSRDAAMRQLRADQAYHMDGRGWCDLGYNFVVDKFGNIYEGAAGSMTAPIIGAHAAPFNTGTVGISVLGCYGNCSSAVGNATMPQAAIDAVGRVAGWRLGAYGVDANSTIRFSTSSATRTMPAIVGHRDVAATACPGDNGYSKLGQIRAIAAAAQATPAPASTPISYRAHVQNVGWQSWVGAGSVAGTSGRSLRVEALQFRTGSGVSGGIECSAHVQNVGWTSWAGTGKTCGTSGRGLRVEALRLRLTGKLADQYDVHYRVHVQNVGWMGWAKNGANAGTAGAALRSEAVEVRLVAKGKAGPKPTANAYAAAGVSVQAHVQNIGWMSAVGAGKTAGTSGRSLGLEALKVSATTPWGSAVQCRAHVQNVGWTGWVGSGKVCGTTGRGLRQEAVQLRLTGSAAATLDIWYRAHVQDVGWMGWTRNGAQAGTAGYSRRVEAVQVIVTPRGAPAPGSTAGAFLSR